MYNYITWRDRSLSEQGQRIYRDTKPIDVNNLPPVLATVGPGVQEYLDYDIIAGVVYYYVISSFKDGIEKFSDPFTIDTSLPALGPGPQVLVGHNESAGFFGEVPTSQLISGDDLAAMLGLTGGTSQNSTAPWLKFYIDGKIVYMPKLTYRHSVTWEQIDAVNAVHDNRILNIKGYRFKIGLPFGSNEDPCPNVFGYDLPETHTSEWNHLFYNICVDNPSFPQTSQIGDDWANYTEAELNIGSGYGGYNWCRESHAYGSNYRVYRGGISVTRLSMQTVTFTNSNFGWRPRLELVQD